MTCRSNYKLIRWIPWWWWWLPSKCVGMWTDYDRTLESFSVWCVLLQIFGRILLQYVSMAWTAMAALHIGKNARKSSKHLNSVVLGLFRWRATKRNLTISAHHRYTFHLNRKDKSGRIADNKDGWHNVANIGVFFSKYMWPMFYLFCKIFYTFVYFNFFLLIPHTGEQWLAYQ